MKLQKLWTYDFTVITIGSLISMVGSSMAGFSISLLVLDYTGSTFLYMLFNVCYQLPLLFMPLIAGPYLDRMSRKKVIYWLDFLSAGLFFLMFLVLRAGWFSYLFLLASNTFYGAINSVYAVAYDSFYPNLITEGNSQRAYAVSSMLWPLASIMMPVAAAVYEALGSAVPIFAANAACFFLAACFERTIRCRETHMASAPPPDSVGKLRQYARDFREGLAYIRGEKGLLCIALYFTALNLCSGADNLILPFFRSHPQRFAAWPVAAVTLYAIVSNFEVAGRLVGGMVQYKVRIPPERKFLAALAAYAAIDAIGSLRLFLPIPLMAAAFFVQGMLGVTSYTIRTTATQAYVPDTMRARFNGAFQMMTSLGTVAGSLLVGALAEVFPERAVIVGIYAVVLLSVYLFIYRGRAHVADVYNRE
ncbi:MAG: MFS transporter [Oscillospiraceae bacterium]|jgi:DHA3 family macrolide efflux protein-like MFS transporter|nr:MFS transporter [Oscillospiraceae bacterium]